MSKEINPYTSSAYGYDYKTSPYTSPKRPYSPHEADRYEHFKKDIAKPLTIADLFPRIDRWGIGILDTLEHLQDLAQEKPSYPPYNIKKFDGGVWRIDMAVAGFRREELDIVVEDRTLTVKSNYQETEEDVALREAEVIHQGIAQRAFSVNFALADYVEVDSAKYADGILTINLITNLPDEKKPKTIDIQ